MQRLKDLFLAYNKHKAPNFPDECRVYPAYFAKSKTTNGLTNCVVAYIRLHGWQAERVNNTGSVRMQSIKYASGYTEKRVNFVKGTGTKGTADISATIDGKRVSIEIKNINTKDRQSVAQKAYQKQIELTGGVYIIATDIVSFMDWYDAQKYPINPRREEYWQNIKI